MESLYLIGVGVIALVAFILCIVLFQFFSLWLRAWLANAPVGLGQDVWDAPAESAGRHDRR